ncbi:MAG: hypothetical protein M3271_10265 [Actinomycetota bacterium]|nr:hypothetical protein [Actinomycetota bacterium]
MRTTQPGLLDGVAGRREPPGDVLKKEGGFSLVTDTSGGRVTKLPSYYVNTSQMYADRDVAVVRAHLDRALEAFRLSANKATYMLTACEIQGRKGLYGSDFFNRSAYRRKLHRLGMRFSDDAFVVFNDEGTFESQDFEPFDPTFVTLAVPSGSTDVMHATGASLVYQFTFYRIANIDAEELARVVRLVTGLDALSSQAPNDLIDALTAPARAG